MRLGSLLLIPAALVAQVPEVQKALPWEHPQETPWQLGTPMNAPYQPSPGPDEADFPLRVEVREDGSIRVLDARRLVTLRTGLPGRPTRAWRDAGAVLDLSKGVFRFPPRSGLDGGIGTMPLAPGDDFRPMLSGLLWFLDDGERILTILNPARGQVAYVPLPAGGNPELRFHPDHLEAWVGGDTVHGRQERAVWTLPWAALLPRFLSLGSPRPSAPPGTALKPFPSEQTGN